jgi:hypothetical protein
VLGVGLPPTVWNIVPRLCQVTVGTLEPTSGHLFFNARASVSRQTDWGKRGKVPTAFWQLGTDATCLLSAPEAHASGGVSPVTLPRPGLETGVTSPLRGAAGCHHRSPARRCILATGLLRLSCISPLTRRGVAGPNRPACVSELSVAKVFVSRVGYLPRARAPTVWSISGTRAQHQKVQAGPATSKSRVSFPWNVLAGSTLPTLGAGRTGQALIVRRASSDGGHRMLFHQRRERGDSTRTMEHPSALLLASRCLHRDGKVLHQEAGNSRWANGEAMPMVDTCIMPDLASPPLVCFLPGPFFSPEAVKKPDGATTSPRVLSVCSGVFFPSQSLGSLGVVV